MKKRIKEKTLDIVFSKKIHKRDRVCQYFGEHNGTLQTSHFYTRNARSVRWDFENADLMCGKHHQFLEERKNGEYYVWKLKRLGKAKFEALRRRYVTLKHWSETEKQDLLKKFK